MRTALILTLIVILLGGAMVPQPAYAQAGSLSGITSILNTVNQAASRLLNFFQNSLRPILEGIQSAAQGLQNLLAQLRSFWEQVVWPISEMTRAKALAQQLIGLFRSPMSGLYNVGVNSAQLSNPIRLEAVMRNRQPDDHGQLTAAFRQTFGALPSASEVHPEERSLIDVDDALAIDQLMTLKMGDAGADHVLQAAESIEDEATRLAPGTSAMVSAAAYVAALQSQAHMQKMIAGQLRQEAARLAHDTMAFKRSAKFTRESRTKMTELSR